MSLASYPSGQRDLTVNQLSFDFGGSNPSLATGHNRFFDLNDSYVVA